MHRTPIRAAAHPLMQGLVAACLACAAIGAQAQAAAPPKPAASAPAKPAAPARRLTKPLPKAPPPEVPLPPADGTQAAAASMVHYGHYACEFNQSVETTMNPKYDGYIDVSFGKQKWTMKPVLSSTGALRLEDVKGQALMIQIAYKSMLMDVVAGHRLVDECVHEHQAAAKKAAEGQAPEGLMGK
jgi:hypothetical protein